MSWIEQRLGQLEARFEAELRQIEDMLTQLRAAQQVARNAYSQWQPSGGGASGVYFCLPTSLPGATGSWPSLTPGSQNLSVYQAAGASLTLVGTFTVYNWYPAAPAASKVLQVVSDGAGNYVAVAQSCT